MSSPAPFFYVALSAWGSRLVNAAVGLAAVRVLLGDLGSERYAAHVLLVGSVGWLLLSDLGLRNAAQNEVSRRIAEGRSYRAVVGAGVLGTVATLPLWGLLLLASSTWAPQYLGGTGISSGESVRAFLLAGSLGLVTSSGNLAFNVWYAQRRGHLGNAVATLTAVSTLLAAEAVARSRYSGTLEVQLLAVLGPPALTSVLSTLALLIRAGLPDWASTWRTLRTLVGQANGFFTIAMWSALLLQLDVWMLALHLPGEAVVLYALASRPFDLLRVTFTALLQAVRPEWTHALAGGNHERFERLLGVYQTWSIVAVTVAALLLAAASEQVSAWLAPGQGIRLEPSLVLAFGCFEVLRAHANVHFMGLVAAGALRVLSRLLAVQVLVLALAQWTLVGGLGVAALPLGAALAYALVSVWAAPWALRQARAACDSPPP